MAECLVRTDLGDQARRPSTEAVRGRRLLERNLIAPLGTRPRRAQSSTALDRRGDISGRFQASGADEQARLTRLAEVAGALDAYGVILSTVPPRSRAGRKRGPALLRPRMATARVPRGSRDRRRPVRRAPRSGPLTTAPENLT